MFAPWFSRWLQARGIHYAWVVMALVFLSTLVTSAALGLPGAFVVPLSIEFGWNVQQISSALAVRFVLFGLMGPFAAVLMARYGLRVIVSTALLLVGGGLALGTTMTQWWQLVALWGVLLGVGSGLTALVLGATVATHWFEQRRGLVLGVMTASSATGQLVFLPLAAWLIQTQGWRSAIVPIGAAAVVVMGLVLAFMRSRPQDLGLAPFGAPAGAQTAHSASAAAMPSLATPLKVLGEAAASPVFWVLFFTFFVCGLSTNGLIQTHFISLCGDNGLAAIPAASVLAMIGGFDFIGTIASGWLSDRYDNRKLLFWYYGLRGLSLLWLPYSGFTLLGLSLFAVFYGLDWVATVPPTVKLTAAHFGRERAAMVFGWVFAGHQLGGAAAVYGAGLTRTLLASYTPALFAAGAACLLAATVIFRVRHPAPVAPPQVRRG